MSRLKLALFDVDGTLIDSQDMIIAAMTRAFGGLGVALPTRVQVRSVVGLSLERAIAALMPGVSPAEVDRAAELYRQSFLALRAEAGGKDAAPLYPGARAALDRLAARDDVLLGVATGKAKRGLDHAIEVHGWQGLFAQRRRRSGG